MMKTHKLFAIAVLVTLTTSCASFGFRNNSRLSEDQAELVSRDFVTAISKLRGFRPRETTVQFHSPSTDFAKKLHDTMRGAGYGLQVLPKDEFGPNHVSYVSEQFESPDGTTVAYEVTVGKVKLGREYEIRLGRVFPVAALSVKGANESGIGNVDNSIFKDTDSGRWMPVPTYNEPVVIVGDTRNPQSDIANTNSLGRLKSEIAAPSKPKVNMAALGESNYSSLFKLYDPTRKEILVFPNDSLTMGRGNKKTLASIANQFDPNTDVISVIGCSHGKTNIDNGNALLANGRASRVKEELIMSNISPDSIYDEGCWAPNGLKDMPPRGVIVTLRTKIKGS